MQCNFNLFSHFSLSLSSSLALRSYSVFSILFFTFYSKIIYIILIVQAANIINFWQKIAAQTCFFCFIFSSSLFMPSCSTFTRSISYRIALMMMMMMMLFNIWNIQEFQIYREKNNELDRGLLVYWGKREEWRTPPMTYQLVVVSRLDFWCRFFSYFRSHCASRRTQSTNSPKNQASLSCTQNPKQRKIKRIRETSKLLLLSRGVDLFVIWY